MDKEQLIAFLEEQGYTNIKTLPDGTLCCINRQLFTTALLVGTTEHSVGRSRYCYEKWRDAVTALAEWDGQEDPPGPWIKEKFSERLGPGAIK